MNLSVLTKNLIKLKLVPGIGTQTVLELIRCCSEIKSHELKLDYIKDYLSKSQINNFLKIENEFDSKIDSIINDLDEYKIKVTNFGEDDYPIALKKISDPPPLLFYKGLINYDFSRSLAVIGSRKYSSYGIANCKSFISDLSSNNFTVISGLAAGIDAEAHIAGMNSGCKCIGVVGHGLKHIYPYSNRKIFKKVIDTGGAIISELLPDVEPHPAFFPQRNRIIAGLSRGTLVIEAAEKSGSLITAKLAFDEGRDVYAIPGDINNLNSAGCNYLIKNNLAKLVSTSQDIISDYGLVHNEKKVSLEVHQYGNLLDIIALDRLSTEELSLRLSKSLNELSGILSELELEGLILRNEYGKWSRI